MDELSNLQSQYRTKPPTPPFDFVLLIVAAGLTTFMVFLAMIGLLPTDSFFDYVKAGVIAIMAGGVSFAVNYYAIERGAELAATGYQLAAIFSVVTILLVGSGISASTYAGMTLAPVNELHLSDYGRDLNRYVSEQTKAASQATRTMPVVRSIPSDLNAKVDCEIKTACLSGRGGGRGPVTRSLENLAARAEQIAVQLEQGDRQRQSIIKLLNKELARFQSTLNDTSVSLIDRRQLLVAIDAKIDQALSDLAEAVPTSLLSAYASELSNGVNIPNRAQASKAASVILANHGRALASVLDTLKLDTTLRPQFPAMAGVSSTFAYIAHFLPIAAIVAVVELILPLTLWIYTFLSIVWGKETATRDAIAYAMEQEASNVTPLKTNKPQRNHRHHQNGGKNARRER